MFKPGSGGSFASWKKAASTMRSSRTTAPKKTPMPTPRCLHGSGGDLEREEVSRLSHARPKAHALRPPAPSHGRAPHGEAGGRRCRALGFDLQPHLPCNYESADRPFRGDGTKFRARQSEKEARLAKSLRRETVAAVYAGRETTEQYAWLFVQLQRADTPGQIMIFGLRRWRWSMIKR